MGTITQTQISNGDNLDATVVNNNFTAIFNEFNGNIDNNNVKSAANIDGSKLLAASVPAAQIKAEAWTAWTPTFPTTAGSQTYTTTTINIARYIQFGKTVFFVLDATGTTGGTPDAEIDFTLPVTAKQANGPVGTAFVSDGGTKGGLCFFVSTTKGGVQRYDAANFGVGAGRRIQVSGVFEAA